MKHSPLTRRGTAALLTFALVLAALPGLAAADSRAGGAIVIEEGETVRGGLDVLAGSVVVRGTVEGDLDAFGGDVTVAETGRVTGSVNAAAGSVRVDGTVDGDLAAGAGSVVLGDRGTVGGTVTAGAETIILGERASVAGDVRYDGTLRNQGAAVEGGIVRDDNLGIGPTAPIGDTASGIVGGVLSLYAFLVNVVVGALLLLALPGFSRRVTDRAVGSPLTSGGVGLLALVVVPVVLLLVSLTIVGIPLSLVGAILFVLVAWAGALYGRYAVGTWLLSYTDVESRWAAFAVGFLLVAVAVRIPLVGGLFDLLVLLLGLGALALVATEERSARRAARRAPDAAPRRRRPDARAFATLIPPARLGTTMRVRVDVVNGDAYAVDLDDSATYADALRAVGFGPHEATVLINGTPVPEDAPVEAREIRVLRLVQGG